MMTTTIITIIRHELGLNRPVSASSNSLFKGLPGSYLGKCDNAFWNFIKLLVTELSAQHTFQKTWDLNGHQLLCIFLAEDFSGRLVFSASHCPSTIVNLQHQRVK
jgi:hypothetical protein